MYDSLLNKEILTFFIADNDQFATSCRYSCSEPIALLNNVLYD